MNDIINVDNIKISFNPNAIKYCVYSSEEFKLGKVVCHLPGRILGRSIEGIGTAIYKDGDKFDVELAKKVAMAKAENNAYKKVRNLITDHINNVWYKMRPYADFLDKADAVIEHNEQYLKKLTRDGVDI